MLTRSRRAALDSSSKSSSTNSSFNSSPSTSKQHNNNNHNKPVDRLVSTNLNNGITLKNEYRIDNNSRRQSLRLIPVSDEILTGTVQQQHRRNQQQQQQQPIDKVEEIVKNVVGNIVDYVSQPCLNQASVSGDYSASQLEINNEITKSTESDSNFLHCNENSIFSSNQPSSSSTTSHHNQYDVCCEFVDVNDPNRIEKVTCEVALDVDMSEDDFGLCPVCELYGRLGFEVHLGDKIGKVCSKRCVDTLTVNGKACICAACDKSIASDSQGYLANFGPERSTLCSEECLLKHEKENEPAQKCSSCKKDILLKDEDSNPSIFFWQTMEFCSPECIENLQQYWGRKCANCGASVPHQSLGKYSVRFGHVIKQFCHGSCLEQYKKAVKVCAYCQVNLSGCLTTCTSITGGSNTKRIREFCDQICRSNYLQMVSLRNSSSSSNNNGEGAFSGPAVQCCQCSRMVEKSSCLDVIFRGRKFLICSTFCLSAFKFSFDITKMICETCSKYGWSSRSANILHYSGITKIFCSRKCLQMHVLKIRRIQSCLTCNVKKYNFDLVEKYEINSGDSKLFCSTYCYAAFEHFESQNQGEQSESFCDWCRKFTHLPFHIPSPDKTVHHFCTYTCVLAQQRKESNDGQCGFDNMFHLRSNQSLTKSNSPIINPTFESTYSQPGSSSSFNYHQSKSNSDLDKDLNMSTGSPSVSISSPQGPSLLSIGPPPSRTQSSSYSPTISDLQRLTRSKTSSLASMNIDTNSISTAQSSHRDSNSNITVHSPYFNCNKNIENRFSTNDLNYTPSITVSSTNNSSRNLAHASSYSLDFSTIGTGVADKSTMWQPSKRSKATLCRPVKKDRFTQTDTLSQSQPSNDILKAIKDTLISETDENPVKYIPVPMFVPFFVPIPVPVPLRSTCLIPLPLPTPIPFGFPIDSRLTLDKPVESTVDCDSYEVTEDNEQQSSPLPPTIETPKTSNSKEIKIKIKIKKPKSSDKSSKDSETIKSEKLSNEYQQLSSTHSESTPVKPVRLKRNNQNFSDHDNLKNQGNVTTNNNNNDNNDSDTCSNTSSSDDREKTKRRRVSISTHG